MTAASRVPSPDEIRDALEPIAQNGVPAPGAAWITDVGTQGFLGFFESEILESLVESGGATCRFFQAVYGAGKTHLLDLLASAAMNRGMAVVRTDLSQAVGLDDWKLVAKHVLQNVSIRVNGQEVRSLPRVLDALTSEGGPGIEETLGVRMPHPGFQNAMDWQIQKGVLSPEGQALLERYLLGESVGAGALRDAGIRRVSDPLSQRNPEQVLSTVTEFLHAAGAPGFMMLFDENERSLEIRSAKPSRRVVTAANLIRRMIDGCSNGELTGFVGIFAVLPGFLDRCTQAYAALGQRLATTDAARKDVPWRWPVLDLPDVSDISEEEQFADLAVSRMLELVGSCGGNAEHCEDAMRKEARVVLESHAGTGYRRPLMKVLATLALREVSP